MELNDLKARLAFLETTVMNFQHQSDHQVKKGKRTSSAAVTKPQGHQKEPSFLDDAKKGGKRKEKREEDKKKGKVKEKAMEREEQKKQEEKKKMKSKAAEESTKKDTGERSTKKPRTDK
ncbi:protein MNN4-like [Salvia miltiorrhiza]|uniref:protein MNN4-like n=1 Tax=Salvia miltiorrhiza TaxID=226208 RepID=UPI0025AD7FBE|nr:protein MNN4-like [Salvia miltiorrhiza]